MALKCTPVSRCLDKKLQIAGFEIPDLLAVFFLLSILNFFFGRTEMKLLCIWLPTLAVAAILRASKRGKPDNYLLHWCQFQLRCKELFAFDDSAQWKVPPRLRAGEKA